MDLHTAAREGNTTELRRIIATGAKLDDRDKHSRTPLHMAGWAGHVECVQALLEAGANKSTAAQDDMSTLHFAAQQGHTEVVRTLINAGLKVNSKTRKGTNALHFAAKKGHLATVQLLIKRKAHVAATDRKGSTALDLATDAAVREALQQALQAAQQPQAPRSEEEKPATGPAIGPAERPEGAAAPADNDEAAQLSTVPAVDLLHGVGGDAEPQQPHDGAAVREDLAAAVPAIGPAERPQAEQVGDPSAEAAVANGSASIGPEEAPAKHALPDDGVSKAPGEQPPTKRARKVVLSHLGDDEEGDLEEY